MTNQTTTSETPTSEPRRKDYLDRLLERMDAERAELIAEMEAQDGKPIPEDLMDFLI